MSKPYVLQAAGILAGTAKDTKVGAFDPLIWLPFIELMVDKLIACRQTPASAYDVLTWRPFWLFDPLGRRLKAHRDKLSAKMYLSWRGGDAGARDAIRNVWAAIDAGRLTEGMLAGMYRDVSR